MRYVNLLVSLNRLEDARLIAQTALQLDPDNEQLTGLLNQLRQRQ